MFNSYRDNTLKFDAGQCVNCGMCTRVCPREVFERVDKTVVLAHKSACMECGACALNCPEGAIEVTIGTGGAVPVILALLGKDEDAHRQERVVREQPASRSEG